MICVILFQNLLIPYYHIVGLGLHMYNDVQPFISSSTNQDFNQQYKEIQAVLYNLLDSPVKSTYHIGVTHHCNYETDPS